MTVAVTGAAGFLGRTFTQVLRDDPGVDRVVGIDLAPGRLDGVEWVTRDVRDPDLVESFRDVDVVVHLAFVVLGDMRNADDINVNGSANVFNAAAKAGCRRVVFASSVAAYGYGLPDRLLTEDDPIRPLDAFPYSRTKGGAERALDETQRANPDLEVVRVRPSIILGPNTHDMATMLTRRRFVPRPGRAPGMQFVHIDDVADAFRLAALGTATGAFNVTGDGIVSYREVGRIVGRPVVTIPLSAAQAGARAAARYRPALGLDAGWVLISQRPPFVDAGRARVALGWTPRFTGRETLEEFVKASGREPGRHSRRREFR